MDRWIDASAERRHEPGFDEQWTESHRLDVLARSAQGPLAVSFQLSLQPNQRRAGFLCAVLGHHASDEGSAVPGTGPLPIVISELEIPLPAGGLEVRTTGLWAEFVCEQPLDHWSYGLEAFALAVDDPQELLGRAIGDRVPIGWELEFEATGRAAGSEDRSGYRQDGTAHGLLLSSRGETEIEGTAVRSHWWGTAGGPSTVLPGPTTEPTTRAALPGFGELVWVALESDGLRVTPTR